MKSLKNLSGRQLEKILANTNAEIKRREHIQAATAEIQVVLDKYKITMQDIDLGLLIKKELVKSLGQVRRGSGLVTTANM